MKKLGNMKVNLQLLAEKKEEEESTNEETAQAYGTDDDIETDDEMEFDENGNDVSLSEDTEEGDDEDSDDDTLDDDEEDSDDDLDEDDAQDAKPSKKDLSKAEIKLINLKKENKLLKKQLADKGEQKSKEQTESLEQSFVDQGYDKKTAKALAINQEKMNTLERKQNIFEFKEANEDVFARFPQAKKSAGTIMDKAEAAGLTAEQICMALYGTAKDTRRQQANRAAQGESIYETSPDNVSSAMGSATSSGTDALTAQQAKHKRYIEKNFNGGERLSVADFLSVYGND